MSKEVSRARGEIVDTRKRRNEARLRAIQAILDVLHDKSNANQHNVLSLFYFLGSFENGLSKESLQLTWPDGSLEEHLYLLTKLGVTDPSAPRLTLSPLMTKYIAGTKFKYCDETLMKQLCHFYENGLLAQFFKYDTPIEEDTLREA